MAVDDNVQLHRGLRNVYIDKTKSTFIDGKEGKLLYRGYSIHDLAEQSSFEETVYLLLHGELPTTTQLDQFDAQLRADRDLPDQVLEAVRLMKDAHPMDALRTRGVRRAQGRSGPARPGLEAVRLMKDAHPMDALRTAVSVVSSADPDPTDISPEGVLAKGIRLTAAAPTMVAAHHRIRSGEEALPPDRDLGHAANFLYMLFGKAPDPDETMLVDKDLLLHAEHGVNASTFAARVAASTRADYYAAITAGIAVLKGPLHGGAAEGVARMAQEIGSVENTEKYIKDLLARRERVMGIGHPVYRALDPRAVHLKEGARALGERKGQPEWFSILQEVTRVMEPYAKRGYHPNVDFWAGAIYHLIGIPEDLFVPVFAVGRVPGWTLHILEQYAANVLLRPALAYTGPMDVEYVPIDRRG